MSPSYSIREATAQDQQAIIRLVNDAFAVETFLTGARIDEERLSKMMAKHQFLVCEDTRRNIIASIYIELKGESGYFGMLAVDPSHQGQGIGTAMMRAADEYCLDRGRTAMEIRVLSLRTELLELYSKKGFVAFGTHEFQQTPTRCFKEGVKCHVVMMSKPLRRELA
jgi:GNAT superfamily N-acetyltransferase